MHDVEARLDVRDTGVPSLAAAVRCRLPPCARPTVTMANGRW